MTTVNDLLFGEEGHATQRLAGALTKREISHDEISISGSLIDNPTVAGAVVDVLDVELSSFVARAWKDHDKVRQARSKTATQAPDREEVGLAQHTVKTSHPLVVEIDVSGVSRPVFEFELELEFELDPVSLTIVDGEIGPVSSKARVEGSLKIGEVKLAERKLHEVHLHVWRGPGEPSPTQHIPPAPAVDAKPTTMIDLRDP